MAPSYTYQNTSEHRVQFCILYFEKELDKLRDIQILYKTFQRLYILSVWKTGERTAVAQPKREWMHANCVWTLFKLSLDL